MGEVWRTLWPLVCLAVTAERVPVSSGLNWFSEVKPEREWDYLERDRGLAFRFSTPTSRRSSPDFFQVLDSDAGSLLVGGKDAVFNLSLADLSEFTDERIVWRPKDSDRELCLVKGKSESDCHNYPRVFSSLDNDTRFILCGTNAFSPRCRFYFKANPWSSNLVLEKEFSGRGFCPYDPRHNSTATFTGGKLYSGTVADFSGSDALIIRDRVRTEQYDLKHLNAPHFVGSVDYGDHVYFFFRETAVEFINCGKAVYSRVARVCKDDSGGEKKSWTSFLKSRLNCSVPGDIPFYFDEIQSLHRDPSDSSVYALFTTPDNALAGSAICRFDLKEISRNFAASPFKAQADADSNWLPVAVPPGASRPGQCGSTSGSTGSFARRHTLMDRAAGSVGGRPIAVIPSLAERLTSIDVARDRGGRRMRVTAGTSDGKVLIMSVDEPRRPVPRVTVLLSMRVFAPGTHVKSVVTTAERVAAVSDLEIVSVPIQRCDALATCADCLRLSDEKCLWNVNGEKCELASRISIEDAVTKCPPTATTTTTTTTTASPTPPLLPTTEESISESTSRAALETCPVCECACSVPSGATARNMESPVGNFSVEPSDLAESPRSSGPNFRDVAKNEELELFLQFLHDSDASPSGDGWSGNGIELDEKVLPKRDSSAPGVSYDQANRVTSMEPDESEEFATSQLYSEQTLAFSSVMSAVIALIVGFIFGILITRFCDGGVKKDGDAINNNNNNNKTSGSVISIANGSLGIQGLHKGRGVSVDLDKAAMQIKGDVLTAEKEDDDGGFRSLPSTRSLAKTAAVANCERSPNGVLSVSCNRRKEFEKEAESASGGRGISSCSSRGSTSASPSPLMPAMLKSAVTRNNSLVKALAAGRAERVDAVSTASPACQQQGTEVAIQTSPRDGNSAVAKVKRIYI